LRRDDDRNSGDPAPRVRPLRAGHSRGAVESDDKILGPGGQSRAWPGRLARPGRAARRPLAGRVQPGL